MPDALAHSIDQWLGIVFFEIELFGAKIEALVLWMALAMAALTAFFRGAQFRWFFAGWRLLFTGDGAAREGGEGASPYCVFATSLLSAVGLGNIAGVAIAIAIGGPGAAFWMIVVAILAMPLRFAEAALGHMYRTQADGGAPRGGPMYFLEKGFAARGRPRIGKALALVYVILALPTFFQFVQVNQAYSQFSLASGTEGPAAFAVIFTLAASVVIFRGSSVVMHAAGLLLPVMCGAYLISAGIVLAIHASALPGAVALIVEQAFRPEAGVGGLLGVFVVAMRRTVYSTEAGLGSAAVFHAASRRRDPVEEGLVAMLEPFIDTAVISTLTALVIVATGVYKIEGLTDIQLTSQAFASALPGFGVALAAVATLFAFSTVVGYAYYFERIWAYAFQDRRVTRRAFRTLYCLSILPGPFLSAVQAIGIIDGFFFLLSIPNIIGIYYLAPELKHRLALCCERRRAPSSLRPSVEGSRKQVPGRQ